MKIKSLLAERAKLYRFQKEWKNNPQRIIQVNGREERRASSPMLPAYCFAYAHDMQGIAAPRRWKSSFATTNAEESTYISYQKDNGAGSGIREVILKPGTVVGWVEDDFNRRGLGVDASIYTVKHKLKGYIEAIGVKQPAGKKVAETLDKFSVAYETKGYDYGYEQFVEAIAEIDQYIENGVDLGVGGLLSDAIAAAVESRIKAGTHGVDVIENIPSGNYEIWFEGPYEAREV